MLTRGGSLCDEQGNLGPEQFEAALRNQMKLYIQRQLSNALILGASSRTELVQLGTLKAVLREQAKLHEDQARRDATQESTSMRLEAINHYMIDLQSEMRELVACIRGLGSRDVCSAESHRAPILFSRQVHEMPCLIDSKFENEAGTANDDARVVSLSPRSYAEKSGQSPYAAFSELKSSQDENCPSMCRQDKSLQATLSESSMQVQQIVSPHAQTMLDVASAKATDDGAGSQFHNGDFLMKRCPDDENDSQGGNSIQSLKGDLVSNHSYEDATSQVIQRSEIMIPISKIQDHNSPQDVYQNGNNFHYLGDAASCQTPPSISGESKGSNYSASNSPECSVEKESRFRPEESTRISRKININTSANRAIVDYAPMNFSGAVSSPDQNFVLDTKNLSTSCTENSLQDPLTQLPGHNLPHENFKGIQTKINSLEGQRIFHSIPKIIKSVNEIRWSKRVGSPVLPLDIQDTISPVHSVEHSNSHPTTVTMQMDETELREPKFGSMETRMGEKKHVTAYSTSPRSHQVQGQFILTS